MSRDKIYAIHIIDNWDGYGDRYWVFARKHGDGYFVSEESGIPLIQYEGDQILRIVPLSAPQEPVAWLVRERTFCGDVTTNKDSADFCEQLTPGSTTPLYTRPSPSVSALVEALSDLEEDISDRFDMESQSTNPGLKAAVMRSRAVLATYRNQKGES